MARISRSPSVLNLHAKGRDGADGRDGRRGGLEERSRDSGFFPFYSGSDGRPGRNGTNGGDAGRAHPGTRGADVDATLTRGEDGSLEVTGTLSDGSVFEGSIQGARARFAIDARGGRGGHGGDGGDGGDGENGADGETTRRGFRRETGDGGRGGNGGSGGIGTHGAAAGDGGDVTVRVSHDATDLLLGACIDNRGGEGGLRGRHGSGGDAGSGGSSGYCSSARDGTPGHARSYARLEAGAPGKDGATKIVVVDGAHETVHDAPFALEVEATTTTSFGPQKAHRIRAAYGDTATVRLRASNAAQMPLPPALELAATSCQRAGDPTPSSVPLPRLHDGAHVEETLTLELPRIEGTDARRGKRMPNVVIDARSTLTGRMLRIASLDFEMTTPLELLTSIDRTYKPGGAAHARISVHNRSAVPVGGDAKPVEVTLRHIDGLPGSRVEVLPATNPFLTTLSSPLSIRLPVIPPGGAHVVERDITLRDAVHSERASFGVELAYAESPMAEPQSLRSTLHDVQLKRSFADNPAGKIVVVHDGHAPSALLVAWDALSAELGLEVRELDRRHEVSAPQRLEQKAAAARGAVFVFLDDSDVYAPRRALGDAVRESSIGALVQSAHALPLHLGAQHGARDEEPPSSIVADARITDVDALRTDTMRFALCKALPFPLKVERFEALLGDDTPMRDALLRAVVSDLAEEQRVAREHVDTTLPRLQQLTEAFGGVRFEEARSEVLLSLVSDVRALTRLGERTRDRVLFHRPLHEVTRQTDAMLEGLLTRVCGEPKTKSGADARRLVNFGAKRRAEQWKAVIDAKSDRMKLEPAIVPSMPRIEAMTTDFAVRLDNEARAAAPSSSKDAAPKSSRR